ncbi:MAG: crossover junction endodeoxyribonuclease RuvC [Candidatus Lightella neohaematopini]|nr:crossover junction endodeoxyribonuclease RuvC [Candidatus Lightella neohaematopini]MCV2531365.1 crossover junction endodeoxyribonuclease RuvC [Candidatus Lightella neohaematopini]
MLNNTNKIILGIDPGLNITGYGLIKYNNVSISYLYGGYVYCGKFCHLYDKLKLIYNTIYNITNQFLPNYIVVEKIFVSKNADTAIKLGHARGVAIAATVNFNIPLFEYTARQVKKIIVGKGSADKLQVKYNICKLLNLKISLKLDVTDALAIAVTHYYNINSLSKLTNKIN